MSNNNSSKSIFISYAHEDRKWVEELNKFIVPWIRNKRIKLWEDSKISIGSKWKDEINYALDEANVAVLLVTKDFLNSQFIVNYELPIVFDRVENNRLKLIWIAIGYSSYKASKLKEYQSANDPEKPIEDLRKTERDKIFTDIAEKIVNSSTIGSFATSLEVIDSTSEPIRAIVENRPEKGSVQYGVQAIYEAQADKVSFTGSTALITVEDLKNLPEEDKEFIAEYEDSLKRNYNRWKIVRQELGTAGGSLDHEINQQLTRISKLICEDLNHILEFLRKMHKYELDDHYGKYRYFCEQIKSK